MSQELVHEIKEDPNYKKFLRIVENVRKRIDLDVALKEALGLHASRTSRNLHGEDRYSPTKLIDASLKDLSYRARLVEIRVKLDIAFSNLKEAIDAIRRHISTEYSDELRDFSTAEQRRSFVDRVIKNSNQFLVEGEALITTLDHLIKDLDQSGHSMRHIIECLKLVANNSGRNIA
jgi:hypothetical protein